MLDHLRQRVIDLLEPTQVVTLSTCGPAGIQAQILPTAALGLRLYILVPTTSEHLFNLEQEHHIVVTTNVWQLYGDARELLPAEIPPALPFAQASQPRGFTVIEVKPTRMQIGRPNGTGFGETIDIQE